MMEELNMKYYNMPYTVYIHTNKVDGKKYVGITKQEPEKRWNNGVGYKSNHRFYEAIEKTGWENFDHDIIATGLSKMDAEIMEAELIAQHQSDIEEFGYNIRSGNVNNIALDDDTKSVTLTIRMNSQMKAQLEYIANNEYRTINGLVNYICAKYIDQFNKNNE